MVNRFPSYFGRFFLFIFYLLQLYLVLSHTILTSSAWRTKWPLRKVYKSSSSLVRWDPLNWIFQPVRGARKISVSYTWTGLTVWTVMMPETPNHFIPIQRHVSQRMGEGSLKDTISSHTSPFKATLIRLIAFPLIACYDIVHQDRDAFPVLLTLSSSSESSPSGWSSSSSLLSVSLISGRL